MTKYIILAIIILIINFIQSFFLPSGGVYADSLSYFEIASDLPNPVTNLFPVGYPAALRGFFEIFKDYFWASKFLNTAMILIIFLFSYMKRFYFRETVLLFTGKTFLFVFSIAISEGLFVFLLYFLLYYLYQILAEARHSYKDVFAAAFIMLIMFTVRYSGIYVYLSLLIFAAFFFFNNKNKLKQKQILMVLVLSGLGIAGYLLFNLKTFGSFTGENLRGKPEEILPIYVLRDLLGTANAVNPYIGLKPSSNSIASLAFQFFILLIDVLVFIYFLRYFKKAKDTDQYDFHKALWIIAFGYASCLIISGWFQQIEEMNVRMMAAANVCVFFSFLILYFKIETSHRLIWRVGCFFLAFITLYSLKSPANYFDNKKQIEPQMSKFKNKKFLYNNERGGEDAYTTYYIPVIKKTFQYKHTNNQKGDIKQSIAGSINPKIKWLKYDTVKDKSQVLYTSELSFKK